MRKQRKKLVSIILAMALAVMSFTACGSDSSNEKEGFKKDTSVKDILTKTAKEGSISAWGLGDQYEIYALLAKYNLKTKLVSQSFDMDAFDSGSVGLACAMTYNELGLLLNNYDGCYNYAKDSIGVIDFNKEGVAMLEDNLICTKKFAEKNPNTVKAFIAASMKGWQYAVEHQDEAAQIVFNNGSSVSMDHQKYMASEMAKLVTTDVNGKKVSDYGKMDKDAMGVSLDIDKKYLELDDKSANDTLQKMTLDDVCDDTYWTDAMSGKFDTPEKKKVSIQLKYLPQAQFMGYFVAKDKGYYDEVGLDVNIIAGGGDISETTAVYNGTVDFGSSWFTPTVSANAAGMGLIEISQVSQSAGMVLVYKKEK